MTLSWRRHERHNRDLIATSAVTSGMRRALYAELEPGRYRQAPSKPCNTQAQRPRENSIFALSSWVPVCYILNHDRGRGRGRCNQS